MLWFVEVLQLLLHDDVEQIAPFHRNHAHRRPSANRLQRRMDFLVARRGVPPPRLKNGRSNRRKRVDSSFRQHTANEPYTLLALDSKMIIQRIHSLVPEELAVDRGEEKRILNRPRPSKAPRTAPKQTMAA